MCTVLLWPHYKLFAMQCKMDILFVLFIGIFFKLGRCICQMVWLDSIVNIIG